MAKINIAIFDMDGDWQQKFSQFTLFLSVRGTNKGNTMIKGTMDEPDSKDLNSDQILSYWKTLEAMFYQIREMQGLTFAEKDHKILKKHIFQHLPWYHVEHLYKVLDSSNSVDFSVRQSRLQFAQRIASTRVSSFDTGNAVRATEHYICRAGDSYKSLFTSLLSGLFERGTNRGAVSTKGTHEQPPDRDLADDTQLVINKTIKALKKNMLEEINVINGIHFKEVVGVTLTEEEKKEKGKEKDEGEKSSWW
jgi:hypothetical protein